MQDYNSLESAGIDLWDMLQDSGRWEVFRIGPFSHNILTVNGKIPKVNCITEILRTRKPERPTATDPAGADLYLAPLYEDLAYCLREVRLSGSTLSVTDRVEAGDTVCTVRWAMCSEAEAVIDDGKIVLRAGGKRRVLEAATEGDAVDLTPHVWPTTYDPATPDLDGMQYLHPTDAPNPGTALVGFTFTLRPHRKAVLHVVL